MHELRRASLAILQGASVTSSRLPKPQAFHTCAEVRDFETHPSSRISLTHRTLLLLHFPADARFRDNVTEGRHGGAKLGFVMRILDCLRSAARWPTVDGCYDQITVGLETHSTRRPRPARCADSVRKALYDPRSYQTRSACDHEGLPSHPSSMQRSRNRNQSNPSPLRHRKRSFSKTSSTHHESLHASPVLLLTTGRRCSSFVFRIIVGAGPNMCRSSSRVE